MPARTDRANSAETKIRMIVSYKTMSNQLAERAPLNEQGMSAQRGLPGQGSRCIDMPCDDHSPSGAWPGAIGTRPELRIGKHRSALHPPLQAASTAADCVAVGVRFGLSRVWKDPRWLRDYCSVEVGTSALPEERIRYIALSNLTDADRGSPPFKIGRNPHVGVLYFRSRIAYSRRTGIHGYEDQYTVIDCCLRS